MHHILLNKHIFCVFECRIHYAAYSMRHSAACDAFLSLNQGFYFISNRPNLLDGVLNKCYLEMFKIRTWLWICTCPCRYLKTQNIHVTRVLSIHVLTNICSKTCLITKCTILSLKLSSFKPGKLYRLNSTVFIH